MPINPYRLAQIKRRVLRGCGWLVLLIAVLWVGRWLLFLLMSGLPS